VAPANEPREPQPGRWCCRLMGGVSLPKALAVAMDEMRACDSAQAPCCATCNAEAPDRRSPQPPAGRNNARERPPLGDVQRRRGPLSNVLQPQRLSSDACSVDLGWQTTRHWTRAERRRAHFFAGLAHVRAHRRSTRTPPICGAFVSAATRHGTRVVIEGLSLVRGQGHVSSSAAPDLTMGEGLPRTQASRPARGGRPHDSTPREPRDPHEVRDRVSVRVDVARRGRRRPAGGVRVDLGVAWHARPSTVRSDPDVVLGAVTMQARAVTSQPTLQLAALHPFVRVAVGCAQCAGQQARGAPARRRAPG
jgi:hypothetical protein